MGLTEDRPVWAWGSGWHRGPARLVGEWIEVDARKAWRYDPYKVTDEEEQRQLKDLPFTLARITSVDAILDFVGQYGLLHPHRADEGEVYREKVGDWFAAAREFAFLIAVSYLCRAVTNGDNQARAFLRKGWIDFFPHASGISDEDLRLHADMFVAERINVALQLTAPMLVPEITFNGTPSLFRVMHATQSPFQFAIWQLAMLLSRTTPFLPCANPDCGKYFEQEDPRQRYCSPACSARMRQRRVRGKRSTSEPAATDGNLDGKPVSDEEINETGSCAIASNNAASETIDDR
ncbi:MAG: hypothetical protein AVDCRST_MAG93-5644 [uncultured Chloroflexia bacterium]|uniref:Zinc finger CGNR domain-containing protein n=1 Tax=uncultured Chloroflexia bacterium TaxID=1672391 RepID=A0A6J4KZ53_9CHLR|nr:MAG: hypothetical protein AVDCRST_MAG93-5644 [uncultured Chloroflexia bacterium]